MKRLLILSLLFAPFFGATPLLTAYYDATIKHKGHGLLQIPDTTTIEAVLRTVKKPKYFISEYEPGVIRVISLYPAKPLVLEKICKDINDRKCFVSNNLAYEFAQDLVVYNNDKTKMCRFQYFLSMLFDSWAQYEDADLLNGEEEIVPLFADLYLGNMYDDGEYPIGQAPPHADGLMPCSIKKGGIKVTFKKAGSITETNYEGDMKYKKNGSGYFSDVTIPIDFGGGEILNLNFSEDFIEDIFRHIKPAASVSEFRHFGMGGSERYIGGDKPGMLGPLDTNNTNKKAPLLDKPLPKNTINTIKN